MTNIDYKKITMPDAQKYTMAPPIPNNIVFYNTIEGNQVEVLRITKDGITANPNVPVDEAAQAVIRALDGYIKNLMQRTWVGLKDDDEIPWDGVDAKSFAKAIEAKLKEKNT